MSETISAPLAASMTAAELFAGILGLRNELSKSGTVSLIMGDYAGETPVHISIRPDGWSAGAPAHSVTGKSWPETMEAARQWIANHKITSRDATIRKMALAIIELTDEHTRCTEAMLVRKGFDAGRITELHEAACQRAGEMAGNAPFRVEFA